MSASQLVGVTYTGSEEPFVDRIYRSRLTFDHGQTRELPPELAAKFLLHVDVFQPAAEKKGADKKAEAPAKPEDDTEKVLDEADQADKDRRKKENERFELHQQIDKMDKPALREWTKVKFQQDLAANLGIEKMRDRVKGFVDQYGAP